MSWLHLLTVSGSCTKYLMCLTYGAYHVLWYLINSPTNPVPSIIIILPYMPFRSPGTHASNHTFTPDPPDILTISEAIIARGKPTGLDISLLSITLYTNTGQCFKRKRHNIRHCISLLFIKKLICSCTRENKSYWIWLHKQPGNKSSKQLKNGFPNC